MSEIIRVEDQFYILATSSLADIPTHVLKYGDTFAVFDQYGDIRPIGEGEQGLYYEGTRFLSRMELHLNGDQPLFLSSSVREDTLLVTVDLTNPDVTRDGVVLLPHSAVHLARLKCLWQGVCYERIRLAIYGDNTITLTLELRYDADFADIFEVRGATREQRGRRLDPVLDHDGVVLGYVGRDEVQRQTRISFMPLPQELSGNSAVFTLELLPREETMLYVTVTCETVAQVPPQLPFDDAFTSAEGTSRAARLADCAIITSNEQFNDWLNRSIADLHMMISTTEYGPYPYAGVPWFSTPFGRDGIITALETLWFNPTIARGVLAYLAATQADAEIPERDAEPGKILHEARKGEMAALGEIPFGRYYGGIDTTPLFVLLAGTYYEHTADLGFVKSIWPNIERALAWIDTYGDIDGDGFVEYARRSDKGLLNQGWKDSHDSIFHHDGRLAAAPIALCEVQGYVYAARRSAAAVATALGHPDQAEKLRRQAEELRQRFEEAFWCDDMSTYALALDGDKNQCQVRSSNAGHCLFSGIASPEHARRVAQTLMDESSFSGWGVRTIPSSEARYNPMSYHNGSIWPHDNALIAAGLARYGLMDEVQRILTGLFDASIFLDLHRQPELFCGFHRRRGEGPTHYPVACAPQVWATGAVFMLLQSCLGLTIAGTRAQVYLAHSRLPQFLQGVQIQNLRVGDAQVDLVFERHPHDVGVIVTRRQGQVEVLSVK